MPRVHYNVIDLGTLGGSKSTAVALNNKGQVIGQSDRIRTEKLRTLDEGFLWENGLITSLQNIQVRGINESGWIVGCETHDGFKRSGTPFRRPVIMHEHKKELIPTGIPPNAVLNHINDRNAIAGWFQAPDDFPHSSSKSVKNYAFSWNGESRQVLETEDNCMFSEAKKVNAAGHAAGYFKRSRVGDSLTHRAVAAVWDDEGLHTIEPPPEYDETRAIDINDRNQVLCCAVYNQIDSLFDTEAAKAGIIKLVEVDAPSVFRQCGFLYCDGQINFLCPSDDTGWNLNIPRALNNLGQVVGTSGCGPTLSESPRAFIFDAGEVTDLNVLVDSRAGWTLTDAKDINDHGQIVGIGNHNGNGRGFLLDPL